ncbi:MAG TPA: hypothetical protein VH593_04695, partial [Ktedonobacteraceae bacterium]
MAGVSQSTPARSQCNICIENAGAGETSLILNQAIAATITLPSLPSSGISGFRVHVQIINNTASGTLSFTGFDINGNATTAENVSFNAIPSARLQSASIARFDYVSDQVFGAGTVVTIATTGGTNGTVTAGAIQAGKYLLPITFKGGNKTSNYSPNEATGLIEKDTKILQGTREVSIDNMDQDLYPDTSIWWAYVLMGIPQITTLPGTPTTLLATTAIASTLTLTTPPTAPAMRLILTITSFSHAGTLTINGTTRYGVAVNEAISITANGTYYSSNSYASVTNITMTGGAAGSVAVTGVFGWKYTWTSGGTQQTLATEHFDGSGSYVYPFSYYTDGDYDIDVKGNAKLTAKGMAQDKLPIGDRTTTPLSTNRVNALTVPVELPTMGWQHNTYLDAISGTPGTTLRNVDKTMKVSLKCPVEAKYNL